MAWPNVIQFTRHFVTQISLDARTSYAEIHGVPAILEYELGVILTEKPKEQL